MPYNVFCRVSDNEFALADRKKTQSTGTKHGFYIPIMNFEVAEPSKNLETKLDRVGLKLDLLLDLPNSTYQTRVFSDTFVTFANST